MDFICVQWHISPKAIVCERFWHDTDANIAALARRNLPAELRDQLDRHGWLEGRVVPFLSVRYGNYPFMDWYTDAPFSYRRSRYYTYTYICHYATADADMYALSIRHHETAIRAAKKREIPFVGAAVMDAVIGELSATAASSANLIKYTVG